jgi:hypothetical protein
MSRFYDRNTQARVDGIPKKDGSGLRDATIADARKNMYVPSVTTVIDVVAKPFLLNWLQTQAFDSAWSSAATPISKEEAWAYYQQQSAIARDRGSDLHDKMSRLEQCPETLQALAWIGSRGYTKLEHEVQFAAEQFGGTIDLIGVHSDSDKLVDLLDFKFVTKDRQPYDSELWQLSAYREALIEQGWTVSNVYNLYISQESGALLNVKHWTNADLLRGYVTFQTILDLWQQLNNYAIGRGKIYE